MSENRRLYEYDRDRRDRHAVSPVQKYREILRGINDQLLYQVAAMIIDRAITRNPTVTREELARTILGAFTTTTDRKIRKIVKILFKEKGIPIGATSTQTGYFLITNETQRDAVKKDHVSRRDEENETIRLLDNIDFGREYKPPEPVNQPGLGLS
ncbi:MAG TPA: hypothetical protein DCP32_11900 [Anaerolineaceae bacterium]|nr:hypothetical protein [Anaerolineaceae bacterium]HBA91895.1 hypothetical protein [Anaerolineaceae bacterium]